MNDSSRMRKTYILMFGVLLILTFGVSMLISYNATDNEHIEKNTKLSVGVVLSSLDTEGNVRLKSMLEDKSLGQNMYIQIRNSNNSGKTQYEQVKELIRSGINVLAIDSVDDNSKHVYAAVGYALSNDVKVIQIGSKIDGYSKNISYIGFDNYLSGEEIANYVVGFADHYLKHKIDDEVLEDSDIAKGKYDDITTAIFLKENNKTSTKEFENSLKSAKSDKFELLKSYKLSNMKEEDISEVLEKSICEYGKVDVVICNNDYIASLVAKVAKRNDMNIYITGQGLDMDACNPIAESKQLCTIYKDYEQQAKDIIRVSKNLYSDGEKENVVIATKVVDNKNVEMFKKNY